MEKEIQQLQGACLILARAIELGRISGVLEDVQEILEFIKE